MASCLQERLAVGEEAMEVDEEEGYGGEALTDGLAKEDRDRQGGDGLPPHWLKMPTDTPTVAVDLSAKSEEYNTILALFLSSFSLPGVDVCRIFRVQSFYQWKHFLLKREEMKQEHGRKEVEEKQLFHGTKCCNVDSICRKGFDWRLSARTKYGEGCYFARSSRYSHSYSTKTDANQDFPHTLQSAVSCSQQTPPSPPHPFSPGQSHSHHPSSQHVSDGRTMAFTPAVEGVRQSSGFLFKFQAPVPVTPLQSSSHLVSSSSFHSGVSVTVPPLVPVLSCPPSLPHSPPSQGPRGLRYMFLARVLIGQSIRGHSSYRRPPALNPGDPHGASFDSCVDYERDPSIFVIFDSNQAYPEYVLEYTCSTD